MQIQAYLLDIARSSTIQRRPPSLVFFVYATTRMRNPEQRATVWGKTTPTRDRHGNEVAHAPHPDLPASGHGYNVPVATETTS